MVNRKFMSPLDLKKIKVFPLAERASESALDEILVNPSRPPAPLDKFNRQRLKNCVQAISRARKHKASVMLIYGAHLIKNGGQKIINQLIENKIITHVATNGAGIIHDWEFAFFGRSTESVRKNVATGTFGTWDETGRTINLAALLAGVADTGLGNSLGKLVEEETLTLPAPAKLEERIRKQPQHPLTAARADLLQAMRVHKLPAGVRKIKHAWRKDSVLATAFKNGVPLTVHPGIGYDIFSNHPMFNGAAIGRAAQKDFQIFGGTVENLDDGVVLSVGSAIMGPQVFEKSISCVNNLRLQAKRKVVSGHDIYVVDLQDGGNWDWSKGEPPKTNPAYYLRFCKSYARMGGTMQYLQCDNVAFLHNLLQELN
jgi:hypothetical protein